MASAKTDSERILELERFVADLQSGGIESITVGTLVCEFVSASGTISAASTITGATINATTGFAKNGNAGVGGETIEGDTVEGGIITAIAV